MGSKYTDANLIPYDQTIVWCSYDNFATVWLELRNYADVVIEGGNSDMVAKVIVGIMMSNGKPQALDETLVGGFADSQKLRTPIPLGHYFDVADIVKLQRKILEFSRAQGSSPQFTRSLDFIYAALRAGLKILGFSDAQLTDIPLRYIQQNLHPKLGPAQAIRYKSYGYSAYFPKPCLMLQEERTRLTDTAKGWTTNEDWRKLSLIKPSNPSPPEAFAYREVFDGADKTIQNEAAAKSTKKNSSALSSSQGLTKVQPKTAKDAQMGLHNMLTRVDCYAFRGDGRPPEMVHEHGGTKANTSRTDPGAFTRDGQSIKLPVTQQGGDWLTVEEFANFLDECLRPKGVHRVKAVDAGNGKKRAETYAEIAAQYKVSEAELRNANTVPGSDGLSRQPIEIDRAGQWLIIPGFEEGQPGKVKERADGYWQIVHGFLMDLSLFTLDQTFKLLISTTKSTAIAKHFINDQAVSPNRKDGHVYAMRCRGGFELPSDVPYDTVNSLVYLSKLHTALHYPEQEVTMPVVVRWDDFVGFRLVLIKSTGPYFAGPIFLHDRLRKEDPKVFDELFELFSGLSQGPSSPNAKGDGRIEQVYSQGSRYDFVAQDKYK